MNSSVPSVLHVERNHRLLLTGLAAIVLLGGFVQRNQRALFVPGSAIAKSGVATAYAAMFPIGFGRDPLVPIGGAGVPRRRYALYSTPLGGYPGDPSGMPGGGAPADGGATTADDIADPVGVTDPAVDSLSASAAFASYAIGGIPGLPGVTSPGLAIVPAPAAGTGPAMPPATIGATDPGAVPEPASWAMMIIGIGAAGLMMRRARRTVAEPFSAARLG